MESSMSFGKEKSSPFQISVDVEIKDGELSGSKIFTPGISNEYEFEHATCIAWVNTGQKVWVMLNGTYPSATPLVLTPQGCFGSKEIYTASHKILGTAINAPNQLSVRRSEAKGSAIVRVNLFGNKVTYSSVGKDKSVFFSQETGEPIPTPEWPDGGNAE